jgi:hypothetical protein
MRWCCDVSVRCHATVRCCAVSWCCAVSVAQVRAFHPITGMESLRVETIAKAQAWQRCGRAGREGPGKVRRRCVVGCDGAIVKTNAVHVGVCVAVLPPIHGGLLREDGHELHP